MVTGVLVLMLVLLASLLAAFIYQIATTPVPAVDAPMLLKSAAAPPAPAPPPPGRRRHARPGPAAAGPAAATAPRGAPRRRQSRSPALVTAGLAAVLIGGWLFLRIVHDGTGCSTRAIEICSQGFVLLTGTQLAGGAIVLAGISLLVIAAVHTLRS